MQKIAQGNTQIDVHVRPEDPHPGRQALLQGLCATPRQISPKYFYDDRGSQLFEAITQQPEYYQTQTERQLLKNISREVIEITQVEELVELGSGASTKTRVLLDAMHQSDQLRIYVPFDISEGMVRQVARQLVNDYPGLRVHGVIGNFEHHLSRIPREGKRLMIFLGGTIGNFEPRLATQFLSRIATEMLPGEYLLLGTDLIKEEQLLHAAYNDAAGITAQFNKNILQAVNKEVSGNFRQQQFEHVAFYNVEKHRIEMWLESKCQQTVNLRDLGLTIFFELGSRLRTEISVKFNRSSIESLLTASGLEIVRWYTDPLQLFALTLARRPPGSEPDHALS